MPALARLLLLLLCLGGWATRVFAVGLDTSGQAMLPAPVLEQVQAFEDTSGRMKLDNILALPAGSPGGFRPVQGDGPKPGFTRSAWWLRAVVRNRGTAETSLVLALPEPRLEYVDFYFERDGRWKHDDIDSTPTSTSRSPLHRYPLARFTLSPGEQVSILIREAGDTGLMLQPKLYLLAGYDALEERAALWGAGLIGGILALGWSALLIAYFSRSTSFLALAAVCIMIALYEASLRGYTRLYFWPHAVEWSTRSIPVFGCVGMMLFLVFILRIAAGERANLPARRILFGFAVLEAISATGAAFGSLYFFGQASLYVNGVFGVVEVCIAAVLSRQATPTARLMLVAVSFGLFNFGLHVLETLGLLDVGPAWLNSDIHPNPIVAVTGLATHLVVLAAWINHVGKQRQEAREELVEQQSSEQQRLRDEVARRTLALNDALLDAQEKNRQKIETLGYVSHDLRAPLATISSYVKLLQGDADSKQGALILAIERSVNYQLSLIDELVGYAKTELRPLEISPSATDLPALLNDIAEYSTALCAQLNNQFFYQALTSLPSRLTIDGRRLQQVLLNLLSNASKFTRDGVVMMTVRARERDGRWRMGFEVADTGIGIEIDRRSNTSSVLQKMQAANGATGLGLVIAQRIVDAMGGELNVSSELGQGTVFSFEIDVPAVAAVGARVADRVPYWSLGSGNRPGRRRHRHEHGAPPEHDRRELAGLAKEGRMTDIERWIARMSEVEPVYAAFMAELRGCLEALDFTGIEALARIDAATPTPRPAS
ncbi:histidine kinase [Trinickia dinghuensis]|uniref:histidine kinase n=2 Tax=Trinickia dinghuensis TaxID=2291023 RepID=A0A3D8JXN9_9BURK|nr:histidine kinase [Trinickia dinghuensis]